MTLLIAFLSLLVERAIGYPDFLYRAIRHPVVWIGSLIALLDRNWNREQDDAERRRLMGAAALAVVVALPSAVAWLAQALLGWQVLGIAAMALLATSLLAQKSLDDHVLAVAESLEKDGLAGGRQAVSMIVGRDPESLDEAGVARAAIESLAENFSDGVVAPGFWLGLAGLPGAAAYKAINTADSMIGHRTARHEAFGRAAARLDDLVNLPASRLAGLLIVAAAWSLPHYDADAAWKAMRRDAPAHRSPNAGWPEAAMAGALGLALAGPRSYGGIPVEDAVMGAGGRREATAHDIRRALRLYRRADWLLIALSGLLASIWIAAA